MKKISLGKIFHNEWPVLLIFALFFVLSIIIFPVMNRWENSQAMKKESDKTVLIKQSLNQEALAALTQAKQIAAEPDIPSAIARNDIYTLPALLDYESKNRGLTFLAVVNKFGVNLASIPLTSNRGDYIFQTTAWGRIAASGQEVAGVSSGNVYPLVIVGGKPLIDKSGVVGAVFAGNLLDDTYVKRFKAQYISNGTQILFYSKTDGPLGSSFTDPNVASLLSAYFNVGTDWVQKDQSGKILQLQGENYYVGNYSLPDLENPQKIIGGVLIFLPVASLWQNLIAPILITLIFLLLALFVHVKFHHGNHKKLIYALIIVLGAILLVATLYFSLTEFSNKIMMIKPPPFTIYNATLKFVPDNNIVDLSSEQRIAIKVTTGGEAINAVTTQISYDPKQVKVTDILTGNSFCRPDLFVQKNIDNLSGNAVITCGLPNPGFNGAEGIVAELLVQPLKTGNFTLQFGSSTAVIANDGLGTDVLRQSIGASYQVTDLSQQTIKVGAQPPAVQIFSSSDPNSERWYNDRSLAFSWPSYPGFKYFYLLDKVSDSVPRGDFETTQNKLNLSVPDDGIYYLHVTAMKDGQVSPVANFRVNIDATPPDPPLILASQTDAKIGDIIRFKFSGSDALSGLQNNFYVKIDNSILFPVLPQLDIPFYQTGSHLLTLRVFDQAGNFRESTLVVNVTN